MSNHSRFGNPFHWRGPGEDEECWWFIYIAPGLVVRFNNDDNGRPEAVTSYLDPSDSKWWHSLKDCPDA